MQHISRAIVQAAFSMRQLFEKFESTCISLMQHCNPTVYKELCFGENVGMMGAGQDGIYLYSVGGGESAHTGH